MVIPSSPEFQPHSMNLYSTSQYAEFILKPFCHFTYATAHSPSLPSIYLRHRLFSNPFSLLLCHRLFTYVTCEPPMEIWIIMMQIKLVVNPQWNKPPLSLSQEWRMGSTNAVNIIIEREDKHIFCLSWKFCLKLFLIDCSKIAILVPEFAVENLPLGRTSVQMPEFAVKDLPLGRTLWWWYF